MTDKTRESKEKQYQKIVETAREVETDQSEEAFDRVLKKIARAPKLSDDEIKELARQGRSVKKIAKAPPPKDDPKGANGE